MRIDSRLPHAWLSRQCSCLPRRRQLGQASRVVACVRASGIAGGSMLGILRQVAVRTARQGHRGGGIRASLGIRWRHASSRDLTAARMRTCHRQGHQVVAFVRAWGSRAAVECGSMASRTRASGGGIRSSLGIAAAECTSSRTRASRVVAFVRASGSRRLECTILQDKGIAGGGIRSSLGISRWRNAERSDVHAVRRSFSWKATLDSSR